MAVRLLTVAQLAVVFVLGSWVPAAAQIDCGAAGVFGCGDTVPAGASCVATSDLACESDPALTIVGPAKVDLDGHRVDADASDDGDADALVLIGKGVKLSDGVIEDCAVGVTLAGTGGHKVERMAVSDCNGAPYGGFLSESAGNKIADCTVIASSTAFALSATSTKNKLTGNTAVGSGFGFEIDGSGHKLQRNRVGGCLDGIFVIGDGHKLQDNTVTDSGVGFLVDASSSQLQKNVVVGGFVGIELSDLSASNKVSKNTVNHTATRGIWIRVAGSDHKVDKNVAQGNATRDLQDDNAACGTNQWKKNTFGSANDGCIE